MAVPASFPGITATRMTGKSPSGHAMQFGSVSATCSPLKCSSRHSRWKLAGSGSPARPLPHSASSKRAKMARAVSGLPRVNASTVASV